MSELGGRLQASRFVAALFGLAPAGSLVEVRFRVPAGMGQRFFSADKPRLVVGAVLSLTSRTDVFVGVLPRVRRGGGLRDVVQRSGVVWADCDTSESAGTLGSFRLRPSMVVASGSGQHRHAYWFVREPIDLASVESLNRRLALALGADAGVVTKPHTILRAPGSVNRKHSPPAPVRLIGLDQSRCVSRDELDRQLPRELPRLESPTSTKPARSARRAADRDPLRLVSPRVYFEQLTGQRVGRSGNVRCPFHHEDRTPSLHVYEDPKRGWFCFGCGRGGSIYDLAALLWQRQTRGSDFVELRRELEALLVG